MNQINNNIMVLSPGDPFNETYNDFLKIYLSGSLDISGNGISWQEKFVNGLTKLTTPHPESPEIPDYSAYKFLIMNPLCPVSGEPSIENPQFVEKAQWELGMMEQADVIFCNFLKRSTMLSAIQGYLLWAQSGKVVCRCPIESMFYSQIKVISEAFKIPMVGDTGSVIKVMETIFQSIPKFNELINYNIS
jgi:hypothetical protein